MLWIPGDHSGRNVAGPQAAAAATCVMCLCAGPGQGLCSSGRKTETWIGMPHRVRLDIYLVGYGREEGEGEKRRERTERERNRREGEKGREAKLPP